MVDLPRLTTIFVAFNLVSHIQLGVKLIMSTNYLVRLILGLLELVVGHPKHFENHLRLAHAIRYHIFGLVAKVFVTFAMISGLALLPFVCAQLLIESIVLCVLDQSMH